MTPEISVVIPTYGRPASTARAIRSVLRQEGVAAETIVVDDASPEPFRLPADVAHRGVRLLRLDRNGGPAGARNAGVAAAGAPLVAFVDSDDFLWPGSLAPRVSAIRDRGEGRPTLFAAEVWRWRAGGGAVRACPIPSDDVQVLASGCWYFPGSTAILSRATWERVGPLDEGLRRLEDLDWGVRLGRAGGAVEVLPVLAAVVERSPRAASASVNAAADRLVDRYRPGGPDALGPGAFRRLRAYLALERASSALGGRDWTGFAMALARSLAARPRLGLHQERFWTQRPADPAELRAVEALARELAAPGATAP